LAVENFLPKKQRFDFLGTKSDSPVGTAVLTGLFIGKNFLRLEKKIGKLPFAVASNLV
jgi:hypothetical protein